MKKSSIINHIYTLTASDLLRYNVTGWLLLGAVALAAFAAFRPPSLITTLVRTVGAVASTIFLR